MSGCHVYTNRKALVAAVASVVRDAADVAGPIDDSSSIIAIVCDDFDLEWLARRLEQAFRFEATDDDWNALFLPPPEVLAAGRTAIDDWLMNSLTIGHLANFVGPRARLPAITPLNLLGRPCQAAGVFVHLQQHMSTHFHKVPHFGPSTPLLEVLPFAALEKLYAHCLLYRGDVLPAWSSFRSDFCWSLAPPPLRS